jgi:dTDP-3-amino-2,3,6-trideoxy-4-keto-D-glucose/dTDP-3-amino-3,4,6-trideoxy-alpha-D-glucose/dTDP-2,6-dideoxy-D-kanosamine transaminase
MAVIPINDLSRQYQGLSEQLHRAVNDVLASGYWLNGPRVTKFADEFARWCGVAHCVPVGNGTDALELALRGLEIAPGDEIITVANAGGYSTTACRLLGAVPVWVDVVPSTQGLDVEQALGAVDERTKAIIVTHLYGIMVDVDGLRKGLEHRGLSHVRIVEDCAQAHGAVMHGAKAGSFGDVAAFSFYPTKNLGACGDAGAVVTDNEKVAERITKLKQYGWGERYHSVLPLGRNSRMDEIQAAILSVKLPYVEESNAVRRAILSRYATEIRPPMRLVAQPSISNAAHLAVFCTPRRDEVRKHLAAENIGTDIHYPVLDCDQVSQRGLPARRMPLPESETAVKTIISLPCFAELTTAEVDTIISKTNSIIERIFY